MPQIAPSENDASTDLIIKSLRDEAAEELYPSWETNQEQWKLVGVHAYHYLGSAIWLTRIGHAMADAMKELLAAPAPESLLMLWIVPSEKDTNSAALKRDGKCQ